MVYKSENEIVQTDDKLSPALGYLANLGSKKSRRTMLSALSMCLKIMHNGADLDVFTYDWSALRHQHLLLLRARLQELYAPATVNKYLSALRGVLKQAWRDGEISHADYARIEDVSNVKNDTTLSGRMLLRQEIEALLSLFDGATKPIDIRDRAIIHLMLSAGLRRDEVAKLTLENYRASLKQIEVKLGKGAKDRNVPINEETKEVIEAWLNCRGYSEGALFTDLRYTNVSKGISADGIYFVVKQRTQQAGLPGTSPHDFRRTAISYLLTSGGDLSVVSKIAGHADPATTKRYDRRDDEAMHTAMDNYSLRDS